MSHVGADVAVVMRNAATNVQDVPNAWMEEAPTATIAAVQDFLAAR